MKIFQKISRNVLKQYSTDQGNNVYILSAVRTPIGSLNGSLTECTVSQLGAVAIKEALERARVPSDDVENIFVGQSLQGSFGEHLAQEVLMLAGLSNSKKRNLVLASGLQNLVQAFQFLKTREKSVCAVVGMESLSNISLSENNCQHKIHAEKSIVDFGFNIEEQKNYFLQDYKNLIEAYKSGVFQDEITKIIFKRKGVTSVLTEDELLQKLKDNFTVDKNGLNISRATGDGAAACILATGDYIKENSLYPLAKVMGANEIVRSQNFLFAQVDVIKKVLELCNCHLNDISQWEIEDFDSSFSLMCMKYLNIDRSLLNIHGGSLSLACPNEMSGIRIVCHLAHSLSVGKLGLAAACNAKGTASALILKKLDSMNSGKPHLTLYTKHPCQLCDEVKEQLQSFEGRYTLEEVNIETDIKKLKKLYRYEIPVLFLDGRFLCKHKLDIEYFSHRLIRSEKGICIRRKV